MSERLAELRQIVTQNFEDMRAILDALADEQLDRRTENGWTVRQVAGHIAAAPAADVFVVRRLAKGGSATLPGFLAWLVDLSNWWSNRKFARASKTDILTELENQYATIIEFINGLDEEELDCGGTVLGRGRMTAYEYLRQSPGHTHEHAATIKAAVL